MRCPKCGSTKMKSVDSDDLAWHIAGSGSLRCKKCDYLVSSGRNYDNLMSRDELNMLKERGEGIRREWSEKSLIRKIRGF